MADITILDADSQEVAVASPSDILAVNQDIRTALQVMDDWDESDRAKVNLIASQAGITGGAGAVAANTPRMTLASDDPAVSSLASAVTALQIMDDWDETDRCKVNLIAGQAGVAGGSGTVSATTQRVVLATDVGLPTGTNSIGQVTANAGTNLNTSALALESGGNLAAAATSLAVLDDWDESDRAKVNLIVGQAGVAAEAGAVGATSQRVTLASDDPAVVALQVIDDWDESDRCKVNPIAGQVGVASGAGNVGATTQRVTLATDDAAIDLVVNELEDINTALGTVNSNLTTPLASEVHLGAVGGHTTTLTVTPTLDTSAYTAGDVLFATTSCGNLMRANDATGSLLSVMVTDKDDQKTPMVIYFWSTNVTFGSANSAPSISDSDAASYLGHVYVEAGDYQDLGGVSVATAKFRAQTGPFGLTPASGTRVVYMSATTSGTPTHTASGLVFHVTSSND